MSIIDLHPEELLDRHSEGTLTDVERSRLGAHVATCAVCRFELSARRDFEDVAVALPRPALVFNPGPARRDVRPGDGAGVPSAGAAAAPTSRGRKKSAAMLLALAAALAGGVSLAAIAVRAVARNGEEVARREDLGASQRQRPLTASPRATAPEAPATSDVPGGAPASPAVRFDDLPVAAPNPVSAGPEETQRPSLPGVASGAAALFREANDARRDGDGARAILLYRRLEAQHPGAEEARLSYATLGRLLLDRGDARSALDAFDQYLSHGGGALGEEALVGRALALSKLGSEGAEIAAWQEILRRFPRSVHARLARSRLSALGQQ